MSLQIFYGVLLFGVVLTFGSALRNLRPGRGLIAFANDIILIVLLVPVLLIAARQITA
jgi:hypothetical protein